MTTSSERYHLSHDGRYYWDQKTCKGYPDGSVDAVLYCDRNFVSRAAEDQLSFEYLFPGEGKLTWEVDNGGQTITFLHNNDMPGDGHLLWPYADHGERQKLHLCDFLLQMLAQSIVFVQQIMLSLLYVGNETFLIWINSLPAN